MNNKQDHCLKKHSKSFYWAGLLLPKNTLQDASSLYAFCRAMDDAIDENNDPGKVRESLEDHKSGQGEISGILQKHNIPFPVFEEFLQALLADCAPVRHDSMESLIKFCYGVAGTVGIMMSHILGTKDQETLYFAIDLGIAMQLVNIARDKNEDEKNGCYYFPSQKRQSDLVLLAEEYFCSGVKGIYNLPVVMRPAIMTAAFLYRDIGRQIIKNPEYAQHHRVIVSKPRKVWLTICALAACIQFKNAGSHDAALHEHIQHLPYTDKAHHE